MRALIVSADCFEDGELGEPLRQQQAKGVTVDVAAPRKGVITGKHGCEVEAGLSLAEVKPGRYDLLVLPGGKAPAKLQENTQAADIARYFLQAGKPVAATCYRGMMRELKAAGVNYQDREVVVDGNLITSRQPADLPAFMQAIFGIPSLVSCMVTHNQ